MAGRAATQPPFLVMGLITILMSMPCHGKMAVHLPIRVIRYTILQNSIEN